MDFFEYASIALNFTNTLWVQFLVGGLCFAIVFVFEAVALYTIASREGYKNKWMAFIPFFNTYYIGVCAQKNKFYNVDTKKLGIAAGVFEAVLFALYIVYYVGSITILKSDVAPNINTSWFGVEDYFYELEAVPSNLKWAAWIYNWMADILSFLELVFCIIQICLLISFFQTYASRRYVLFTITSILFPIQGILFFVVRENKAVNYKDFVREEQARQYRIYQQYQQQNYNNNPYNQNPYNQNPYNNPYNQSPYNQNPNGGSSPTPPDDPFDGLGGSNDSGGSPFDEFDKH